MSHRKGPPQRRRRVSPAYDVRGPFFTRQEPNAEFQDRQEQTLTEAQVTAALGVHGLSPQSIKTVPELTPNEQVNVNSTFDSRPINAADFFKSGGDLVQSTTTLADDTEIGSFDFVIPSGYVAVLRNFAWEFDPIYTQNTITSVRTGLFIDGQAIKFLDVFNDLQITTSSPVNTFVIIDENRRLTINAVRLSNIAFAARGIPVPTFVATFTGNLLQKRNLPPNFEVGSFI